MATGCQPACTIDQVVTQHNQANGLAVIISNDYQNTRDLLTLEATIKDSQNMKNTFESVKLAVIARHNVLYNEMLALLSSIIEFKRYPPTYKRLVLVFSGHGISDHLLYTNDATLTTISINDIVKDFYNASHLAKIPKVFFVDACRGDQRNLGMMVSSRGGKSITDIVPAEGNWLLAYSTLPRHKSYEEQGKGGVWMSMLAEKLRTEDTSLADILTSVNEELVDLYREDKTYPIQQPEYISRLNSNIFFLREAKRIKPSGRTASTCKGYKKVKEPISQYQRANSQPAAPTPRPPPTLESSPVCSLPPMSTSPVIKPAPTKKKSPRGTSPVIKPAPTKKKSSRGASVAGTAPGRKPQDKLEWYSNVIGKKNPIFTSEKVGTRKYIGKAYIPQTCGWISGDVKNTKGEAEDDAAAKLVAKLNIT